jgi:hypothetical protein
MIIQVRTDKNYGKYVLYPTCPQAKLFCQLAKTKTITLEMECLIKKLGYQIQEQPITRN